MKTVKVNILPTVRPMKYSDNVDNQRVECSVFVYTLDNLIHEKAWG